MIGKGNSVPWIRRGRGGATPVITAFADAPHFCDGLLSSSARCSHHPRRREGWSLVKQAQTRRLAAFSTRDAREFALPLHNLCTSFPSTSRLLLSFPVERAQFYLPATRCCARQPWLTRLTPPYIRTETIEPSCFP